MPGGTSATANPADLDEYDNYFNSDYEMTPAVKQELSRIEREATEHTRQSQASPIPQNVSDVPTSKPTIVLTTDSLKQASQRSNAHTFFSKREVFTYDSESEDEDMESENEADETTSRNATPGGHTSMSADKNNAWFKQPKGMANWLYAFFRDVVQPQLFTKNGRNLARPPIFGSKNSSTSSFWINPPEPIVVLEGYRFHPPTLYQPSVFLWLPHFFVRQLNCPQCRGKLEKNGALTPRRVTDSDRNFYIVTWAYYCRDGCQSYFHGWSQRLLNSLPPYVQLGFPAVLSRKSGLSRNVITMLRVGNQHKMGPTGVRAMLYEMHTLRYNTLLLQYLECAFEQTRGSEMFDSNAIQSTLHAYAPPERIPTFGDFADPNGYAGFVPSHSYLTAMMNKAIERDEPNADQHTSCLDSDHVDIDDSHKIIKHIANEDGVPIFNALWTCMSSRYIRAQVLTITKSQQERIGPLMGIATSVKRYGHRGPVIAYTDDPVKDKNMLYTAFPSLAQNLTPMAAAHGLGSLIIPTALKVVFFVGSSIPGDFTRLKKQFNQLENQRFRVIDLKQFAIQRGAIQKKDSGSLDALAEKVLGAYLCKDSSLRQCEYWETNLTERQDLINYAALDVYASRLIFERISEMAPLKCVRHDTAPGTRIAMLTREGGEIAAYGKISAVQTTTFAGIRVKTSSNSRVLVDIDRVVIPSAAAILHIPPTSSGRTRTKAGALTFGQLKSSTGSPTFSVVAPVSLLQFDEQQSHPSPDVNMDSESQPAGPMLPRATGVEFDIRADDS
ncbi:hypothetical protein B0H16DRAFT_1850684 [Mycena metata]|uniref:DUF6729 domain-containing protein n=1 Tax=Mycena metata TaxID=1033252 RepID=A0AAD7N664_9AGAR|nr:hypothetical protein B0H16DRAFT_1850684 [Mycena metata]